MLRHAVAQQVHFGLGCSGGSDPRGENVTKICAHQTKSIHQSSFEETASMFVPGTSPLFTNVTGMNSCVFTEEIEHCVKKMSGMFTITLCLFTTGRSHNVVMLV